MDKKIRLLRLYGLLCFFVAIIAIISICWADSSGVIESLSDKSAVDWQKGIIRATGTGLPPAEMKDTALAKIAAKRAAKIDAYRNLAEAVNGVRVTSETTVKNFTVSDTNTNTRVSGFVKGARETDIKYYSDGMVEVTLEAALNGQGGLSDIILPTLVEPAVSSIEVAVTEKTPDTTTAEKTPVTTAIEEPPATEGPSEKETPATEPSPTYTGLVINAKGLGLQPALSPKILTEENKEEIYGISYTKPQYRTNIGLVGYQSDLNTAKQETRVAQIPYVIKGVEAAGNNKSDVIIKTADAQAFHNIKGNETITEQCRVIIVLE